MPYSIDTSYLIEAWNVWYPYQSFPGLWQVLVSAAADGQLFVIDRVYDELEKQVPDLVAFFDLHAADWQHLTAGDTTLESALRRLETELLAGRVIRTYPAQNIRKYLEVADPIVVLHAQLHHHVVVSNELSDRLTKKGPKLPDLCSLQGVPHATPSEFAEILELHYRPS